MSCATWVDWISYHSTIFALGTEADLNMLAEWARLFQLAGLTPARLEQATVWLATHAVPRFRSDHLAALQERLRQLRRETCAPKSEHDPGRCVRCEGTGLVTVPFLAGHRTPGGHVIPDDGHFRTCVVRCDCALGRWQRQHEGQHKIMPLFDYEVLVPDWRERLEAHQKMRRQEWRSVAGALAVDQALGAIQARARARAASEIQGASSSTVA